MKTRKLLIFCFSILFMPFTLNANIFNRPRRVQVLSTKYFDFIFPKEAEKTVSYLSLEADKNFEEAAAFFELEKLFRLPVAVTFDSDAFYIEYTPSPYHRITIYQAPEKASVLYQDEGLAEEFRKTLFKVAASAKRTKFWEITSCLVGGDALQPAVLLNMPSAFFEGIVENSSGAWSKAELENQAGSSSETNTSITKDGFAAGSESEPAPEPRNFETGTSITKDGFALSLLSEAKENGLFPSWTDLQGSRDIYSTALSNAAMNAFTAYLVSRFGLEKFREYYAKAGEVNFFSLAKGKFKKVYKISLNEVWKDFYDAVPVIENSETKEEGQISTNEKKPVQPESTPSPEKPVSRTLFPEHTENTFSWIYKTPDNLLFYDSSHSEIAALPGHSAAELLHEGKHKTPRARHLVAEITSVRNISLDEENKYLTISFLSPRHNRALYTNTARIFNLEKKSFLNQKYPLSNGTIFDYSVEEKAVAGYEYKDGRAYLKVYPLKEETSSLELYSFLLPFGTQTEALIPLGTGKLLMVLRNPGGSMNDGLKDAPASASIPQDSSIQRAASPFLLVFHDCFYNTQKIFPLPENISLRQFKKENKNTVSFTWAEKDSYKSGKRGIISLKDDGSLKSVLLQKEDLSGGVYDSFEMNGELYFSSHREREHLLKCVPESAGAESFIFYTEIGLTEVAPSLFAVENWEKAQGKAINGSLNGYPISKYHIYKYSLRGSTIPLFPVSEIDFSEFSFAPGLGASYLTNTDPLENITGLVSFCAGYIDTSKKTWTTDNDFSLCGMLNTSILPFDISACGLWKFDREGHYNLEGLLSAKWNTTIALPHNVLTLSFGQLWNAGTTYYDWENETVVELDGWPSLKESYYTSKTHFKIDFSNLKQKGMSTFEKSGIQTSLSLISINDPQKQQKKKSENIDEENQFTASADFGFSLPYTIPVFGLENWVICMPLEMKTQWYTENGTTSESYVELLLAGYEFQQAIQGINLYFQRAGIKVGYDLTMSYDTFKTEDPDIRDLGAFVRAVRESAIDDFVYLNFQSDFSPIVGKFSKKTKFTSGLQFRMHIRSGKGEVKAIFNMGL